MNIRAEILSAITTLLFLATPCLGFEAKVVRILDGDTVEVLRDGRSERIRLNGIDCPEKAQAFGYKAKEFTSKLCFAKIVRVQDHGKDRYGRTIGELILADGRDVNHELVAAGMAWWYRKYAPNDMVLKDLEETAQKEKRGLWVDITPTAPWDFRHGRNRRPNFK